ncbi:MAG: DUF1080 domain-containing protein, partial [Acidobacteriota bacterium]|nr:DUF1080 domain-containing protein [Acidobacteriota bacterium]
MRPDHSLATFNPRQMMVRVNAAFLIIVTGGVRSFEESHMFRRIALAAGLAVAMTFAPLTATRGTFVPDWTFKGSTLDGWHAVGEASWKAADGVLVGTPKSPEGGWLVLDKSLQDVQFGFELRCTGGCRTGVLLRAEKT